MSKVCRSCHVQQDLSCFGLSNKARDKISTLCKACACAAQKTRNNTLAGRLQQLLTTARSSAMRRKRKRTDESGVFNLTIDDMWDMWEAQQGCCYYLGVQLTWVSFEDWLVSLERKDSSLGYIRSNVVLCCLECNTPRHWSLQKARLLSLPPPTVNLIPFFPRCLPGNGWFGPRNRQLQPKTCYSCGEHKPANELKGWDKACVDCKRKSHHLQIMLNHAKDHIKILSRTRAASEAEMRFEIDLAFLTRQYNSQGGRCYYSGLEMVLGSTKADWQISLERLDSKIGYTEANTVFVCVEFQSSFVNWSRDKVDFVRSFNLNL